MLWSLRYTASAAPGKSTGTFVSEDAWNVEPIDNYGHPFASSHECSHVQELAEECHMA